MKILILSFITLVSITALTQNWSPVLVNEKMNFQHSDSATISHTIWVDFYDVTGNDTTFFLNRVIKDYPANPEIALRNQPQFLYTAMNKPQEGVYYFADPGFYILKTGASLNETWVFDLDNNTAAEVTEILEDEIFGFIDSLKIISLSDGNEIRISKSFGILLFPDYENGGTFELVGVQGTEFGESIPGFWEMYDFDIGDIFQHSRYSMNPDGSGYETRKITITSKDIFENTITYGVDGIYYVLYFNSWGGGGSDSYTYTDEISYSYSDDHPANLFPGQEYILPNSGSGYGTNRVITRNKVYIDPEFSSITKEFGIKEEPAGFPFFQDDVFYEFNEDDDTIYRFAQVSMLVDPCGLKGLGYSQTLGEIFNINGCFEHEDVKTLEGFIKNGDTIGIITPDTVLHTALSSFNIKAQDVHIFPNPAKSFINVHVDNDQIIPFILEIRDIRGVVIHTETIKTKSYKMDLSSFSAGIYFYSARNKTIIKSGKLLVR